MIIMKYCVNIWLATLSQIQEILFIRGIPAQTCAILM